MAEQEGARRKRKARADVWWRNGKMLARCRVCGKTKGAISRCQSRKCLLLEVKRLLKTAAALIATIEEIANG